MISHTHASSFNLTPIVSLPFAGIGGNRVFRFRSCWPGLLSFSGEKKNGLFLFPVFCFYSQFNSILQHLFRLGAAKIRLFFDIINIYLQKHVIQPVVTLLACTSLCGNASRLEALWLLWQAVWTTDADCLMQTRLIVFLLIGLSNVLLHHFSPAFQGKCSRLLITARLEQKNENTHLTL